MATNKQTPCQQCAAPAYGQLCQGCSLASLRSRKQAKASVNSVGEFNAGSPSGVHFAKVAPTIGSWWVEPEYQKNRDVFQHKAEADAVRMSRGICGNHRAENAGIINWNY